MAHSYIYLSPPVPSSYFIFCSFSYLFSSFFFIYLSNTTLFFLLITTQHRCICWPTHYLLSQEHKLHKSVDVYFCSLTTVSPALRVVPGINTLAQELINWYIFYRGKTYSLMKGIILSLNNTNCYTGIKLSLKTKVYFCTFPQLQDLKSKEVKITSSHVCFLKSFILLCFCWWKWISSFMFSHAALQLGSFFLEGE